MATATTLAGPLETARAAREGANGAFAPAPPQPTPEQTAERAPPGVTSIPREHKYRLSAFLIIGDWFTTCVAIFIGLQLRALQRAGWSDVLMTPDTRTVQLLAVLGSGTIVVWLMAAMGTYEVRSIYWLGKWFKSALAAMLLTAIAAWAFIGLFQVTEFSPRIGVLYCIGTTLVISTLWRLSAFICLMRPGIRESVSTRLVVVGWNEKVSDLRKAMRRDITQLNEIVGCVPSPGGRFATKPPADLAILGDYNGLATHLAACNAHSIILADLSCPAREIEHLIAFCQRELIGFRMVPEYFSALSSGLQVELISGVPLLSVSQLPLDRALNRVIKRGIDLIGGTIGLLIAAVLVPVLGAIVYAQSPGPIIYPQTRMSRGGRTFRIYKIRSMRMNAEAASGAVWAKRDDPRRLKIGVFMRKYNLDEVPQFWNVVKGDMSLVGPRPERPELIAQFKEHIPNYNARHEVRAGITGWAQVNGLRGDTDLRKRVEADLYYLENWSVLLDCQCILATFLSNKNSG